jgi:thymidylate synthase ThyX
MKTRLVSKTTVDSSYVKHLLEEIGVPEEFEDVLQDPEGLIAYIARVSSSNQTNPKFAGLIRYCMSHGHWSIDVPEEIQKEWEQRQLDNWKSCFEHYQWALDNDIAKECARMVLPLQTKTRMFMNGTVRSWVHYLNLRADPATQKEHREIAESIKQTLCDNFPIISEAAGWLSEEA